MLRVQGRWFAAYVPRAHFAGSGALGGVALDRQAASAGRAQTHRHCSIRQVAVLSVPVSDQTLEISPLQWLFAKRLSWFRDDSVKFALLVVGDYTPASGDPPLICRLMN